MRWCDGNFDMFATVIRIGLRRLGCCSAALFLALGFTAVAKADPISPEYQVKAAFLFNFTKFVTWPTNAFQAAELPFCIGILGDDPFKSLIDEVVSEKLAAGRPIEIKRANDIEALAACQIVFIGRSKRTSVRPILRQLRGRSVLTVSDNERFAEMGGCIQLKLQDDKVRFSINNDAAIEAGLKISSKLLNLAKIVSSEPDGP
jgi:hypothetical protein